MLYLDTIISNLIKAFESLSRKELKISYRRGVFQIYFLHPVFEVQNNNCR